MDKFKLSRPFCENEIDLDDLSIYPDEWKKKSCGELWDMCWSALGKSLIYMKYIRSPVKNWRGQYDRVVQLIHETLKDHNSYFSDTDENKLHWLKLLFRIDDEIENQC